MDYLKSKKQLDKCQVVLDEKVASFSAVESRRYSSAIIGSGNVMTTAYAIQEMLPGYNKIKAKLDEAHKVGNVVAFEKAHIEMLAHIKTHNFNEHANKVVRRKRWLKVIAPLRNDVMSKIIFVRNIRDAGAKWIKRMKMTPARRKAADKSSARMKLAWGM